MSITVSAPPPRTLSATPQPGQLKGFVISKTESSRLHLGQCNSEDTAIYRPKSAAGRPLGPCIAQLLAARPLWIDGLGRTFRVCEAKPAQRNCKAHNRYW